MDCFAQSNVLNVKNASTKILYPTNVNMEARAEAVHSNINSPYQELKPALDPSGKILYFSRLNSPLNTSGEKDHEDIWYSKFDTKSNVWSEPIRMPGELNNAGPNFVNTVSQTGDTLILGNEYLKKGKMRAGVSYSVNVDGQWSFPTSIDIKGDYNMSAHANYYVSLKSGVIISSVQRADSKGERDLYISIWDGVSATEPVNMGAVINTKFEESSPFLANDMKTLYFASKGHSGYGGFDIYVTERLDDSWTNWSTPKNLGPAVNGAMDDEFFSVSNCGRFAIFSKQVEVHNVDLYKISMEDLFPEPNRKAAPLTTDISALSSL
ncbi:hypothetical protein MASR2M41_23330 [Flammeovirgaceae bacterium]